MGFGRRSGWLWAMGLGLILAPGGRGQSSLLSEADGASFGSAGIVAAPVRASLPGMTRTDWSLLGAAAGFRYLDYQTTVKAMSDPRDFHEAELPQALVDNHAGFAAFEASTVVVNVWVYRALVRRGHRKLARVGQVVNVAAVGSAVAHNEYELARYWRKYP